MTRRDLPPSFPPDGPDVVRLARYLHGECGAEEAAAISRWMADDPANAAFVDSMRDAMTLATGDAPTWDVPAMWRTVKRQLESDASTTPRAVRGDLGRRTAPRWTGNGLTSRTSWLQRGAMVGTAALLVLGVGIVSRRLTRSSRAAQSLHVYATGAGERAGVTLRDGTRVTLAPGSRLQLADDFGASARDVRLDGEALFVVQRDSMRPFRVRTAGAMTVDVGTAFVVREYAGEPATRVAVREGTVLVGVRDTLRAGDLGVVNAAGPAAVWHGIDLASELAWTEGRLVFRAAPLARVLADVGRWYDLDITLATPDLAATQIDATFESTEPPTQVLTELAATTGTHIESHGRRIVIGRRAAAD